MPLATAPPWFENQGYPVLYGRLRSFSLEAILGPVFTTG